MKDPHTMTVAILALLIGIILGIIVILVVNYLRGKNESNKATKLIDQAKKEAEKQ
jgi:H+/gluconate symporter-like permease